MSALLDPALYISLCCSSLSGHPTPPPHSSKKANHSGLRQGAACSSGFRIWETLARRKKTEAGVFITLVLSVQICFRLVYPCSKCRSSWATGGPLRNPTPSVFCNCSLSLSFILSFLYVSFQVLTDPLVVSQIPVIPLKVSLIIEHSSN